MANENSTQQLEQYKAESALNDAEQLTILMQWIEGARLVLDAVQIRARYDKEFDGYCKKHSFPFGNADWDTEQSDALTRLCSIQRNFLDVARNATKMAATA